MYHDIKAEGSIYIGWTPKDRQATDWKSDRTKEEAAALVQMFTTALTDLGYDVLVRQEDCFAFVVEYNDTTTEANKLGSQRFATISAEEAEKIWDERHTDEDDDTDKDEEES
jgi:hypothetical protein